MKKGRPAHTVHALCDDATFDAVRAVMIAETGTLGVRATDGRALAAAAPATTWSRSAVTRSASSSPAGRVKVEHDDAVAAARALGVPLRDGAAPKRRSTR